MNKEYCLVLSGGGTKGVYHLGAWKALKELGVKINAVVGNSVGALISGFVAQDNIEGLEEVMSSLEINNFINLPAELVKDGDFFLDKNNIKSLTDLKNIIFKNKGLDTSPLYKMLRDNLSEDKIRNSGIDLGIVTYSIKDWEPVEIFIEDMISGGVLDYLLASATFPGFKTTEINEKKFIDGGIYDNIPFAMAKARGYKNIIIIDISGMGINRKPDITGTNTYYIKNSVDMGSVFDFSKDFLSKYTMLGYLDTLAVFGKYKCKNYFVVHNDSLYNKLEEKLFSKNFEKKIINLIPSNVKNKSKHKDKIKAILPPEFKHHN